MQSGMLVPEWMKGAFLSLIHIYWLESTFGQALKAIGAANTAS